MRERHELISDLKTIILLLFFTYDDNDDLLTKQKLINLLIEVINEEIIQSETELAARNFLENFLLTKVEGKFGEER